MHNGGDEFFCEYRELAVHGAKLPHWQQGEVPHFITFRLADALPADKIRDLKWERRAWLKHHPEPWSLPVLYEYQRRFSRKVDPWLDQSFGACLLQAPGAREVVAGALHFQDGQGYVLDSFAVMPNHVHVLVRLWETVPLAEVVKAWKGYTSHAVNKVLGRKGTLWQRHYWDRLMRDEEHLGKVREYILRHAQAGGVVWRR